MENMKAVYEIDWLIERVYKESDKLIGKIADTSKFEERCIKDIEQYIGRAEENKKNRNKIIFKECTKKRIKVYIYNRRMKQYGEYEGSLRDRLVDRKGVQGV